MIEHTPLPSNLQTAISNVSFFLFASGAISRNKHFRGNTPSSLSYLAPNPFIIIIIIIIRMLHRANTS